MSNNINAAVGSALQKYTFTDDDGEVIASFRLNPTDIRLADRMLEVSKLLEKNTPQISKEADVADVLKYNNELEDKICYILGYDAHESLFGLLSATTILPDGTMFCTKVVDTIAKAIAPELERRKKVTDKHIAKYTKK